MIFAFTNTTSIQTGIYVQTNISNSRDSFQASAVGYFVASSSVKILKNETATFTLYNMNVLSNLFFYEDLGISSIIKI